MVLTGNHLRSKGVLKGIKKNKEVERKSKIRGGYSIGPRPGGFKCKLPRLGPDIRSQTWGYRSPKKCSLQSFKVNKKDKNKILLGVPSKENQKIKNHGK